MITKDTAREIYNCYQQIEEIDNIKIDMVAEIERARKKKKKRQGQSRKMMTALGNTVKACS